VVHLDPTTWGTVTWLILAVAFLFLMVIALFLELYKNKKTRQFGDWLVWSSIERMGNDIRHLETKLEEMEFKAEHEKKAKKKLKTERRRFRARASRWVSRTDLPL